MKKLFFICYTYCAFLTSHPDEEFYKDLARYCGIPITLSLFTLSTCCKFGIENKKSLQEARHKLDLENTLNQLDLKKAYARNNDNGTLSEKDRIDLLFNRIELLANQPAYKKMVKNVEFYRKWDHRLTVATRLSFVALAACIVHKTISYALSRCKSFL